MRASTRDQGRKGGEASERERIKGTNNGGHVERQRRGGDKNHKEEDDGGDRA